MSIPNEKPSAPRKKISTILLSVLGVFLLCGILGLAALPSILSTSWGNQHLMEMINSRISGKIAFKKLNITWFEEQILDDAQLFDAQGHQIASLDLGIAKTTLARLLLYEGKRGNYSLSGLNAQVVQEADGLTNIQHALEPKNTPKRQEVKKNPLVISLNDVNVTALLDEEKTDVVQMSGKTSQRGLEGSFNLNISMDDITNAKIFSENQLNTEQIGKIQIQAHTNNFPVSLLDEALALSYPHYKGVLLAALGDTLDLNIQEAKSKEDILLKLQILSPLLKGTLDGILKEDRLIITESDPLEMTIQPALIEYLNQPGLSEKKFRLKNATKGHLHLSKMNLAFDLQNDNASIDFANSDIVAALKIDQADLSVVQPIDDILLQELNFKIDASKNSEKILLTLDSQVSRNDTSTHVNVSIEPDKKDINFLNLTTLPIKGQIKFDQINLDFIVQVSSLEKIAGSMQFTLKGRELEGQGSLNIDNERQLLSLDTKVQKFPVKLLDQFLSQGSQLSRQISAALGNIVNADVHVQLDHLHGPIIANLNGDNGSILLDAYINKGILTLNKNFRAQVALTEEFGQVILDDIFPLAKGLIGSDNPAIINIDAKGFALPVMSFNIGNLKIDRASLELGKVYFRSNGKLGSVLSLFNTKRMDTIPVQFTPLYIGMKNGAVIIQRLDMLIMDTYPIATWGTVNLVNDKVNMMIGLTGQSLFKGFNILGLGKDYMMQIPFRGTISNATIDKKKATAKIAALVASTRGLEGLLLGTAIHVASGGLTDESAPPPTTNPLPWNTEGDSSPQSATTQSGNTRPRDEVEEKAKSLLRHLLPF